DLRRLPPHPVLYRLPRRRRGQHAVRLAPDTFLPGELREGRGGRAMSDDEKKRYERMARGLSAGYLSAHLGLSIAYTLKKYSDEPLGEFWYELARQVDEHMTKSISQRLKAK